MSENVLRFNLVHAKEQLAAALKLYMTYPCVEYYDAKEYWQKRVQEYTLMLEDQNG